MPVKIVTSTQPVEGPKFVNVFNQNGEVALGFKNDSNVTQTPDGTPLVSQDSGSHLDASLSLNLGFKKGRGINGLKFDFGLGKIDYLDSKFTNRQSENIIFGVSFQKKYAKGNKRITSTSKFQLRHDFLDATQRRELGFRTITLGQLSIFKPKTKIYGYDAIVPVLGIDFEYRDYTNSLAKGTNGGTRDTITPQLLFLAIGVLKKGEINHKTTGMILLRDSYSNSEDQAYLDSRLSVQHTSRKGQYEVGPSLAYIRRDQSDYQGVSRKDVRWEVGLNGSAYLKNEKWIIKSELKYADQKSDITQFVYDNTSFLLSVKTKW